MMMRKTIINPEPTCPVLSHAPELGGRVWSCRATLFGLKGSTQATRSDLLIETLCLRDGWVRVETVFKVQSQNQS